jgi:uncharacterized cupin superfamily protein
VIFEFFYNKGFVRFVFFVDKSLLLVVEPVVGITHFNALVIPTTDRPRAERLVAGNPERTTWSHYQSADGVTASGIWSCEVGCWRIQFSLTKEEFFCVIEGEVVLWDEAGEGSEGVVVAAGEAAVIPAGFVGRFEVKKAVRKYFVVIDRAALV